MLNCEATTSVSSAQPKAGHALGGYFVTTDSTGFIVTRHDHSCRFTCGTRSSLSALAAERECQGLAQHTVQHQHNGSEGDQGLRGLGPLLLNSRARAASAHNTQAHLRVKWRCT